MGSNKQVSQDIFNRVWHHMLCQRKRSTTGDPVHPVAIYGKNGLRDVPGCLITRDNYSPALEGEHPRHPSVIKAVADSLGVPFGDVDDRLISALATIHDCHAVERWERKMIWVAIRHELEVPKRPGLWARICYWFDREIAEYRDFSGFDHDVI